MKPYIFQILDQFQGINYSKLNTLNDQGPTKGRLLNLTSKVLNQNSTITSTYRCLDSVSQIKNSR